MQKHFIENHWNLIYKSFVILGIVCIVFSLIINPAFIKKYISTDNSLESVTIKRLYAIEVIVLIFGVFIIVISKLLKPYSIKKERIIINLFMISLSVFVTLAFIEAALKIVDSYIKPFNRNRHAFFQHDEVLGWKHLQNIKSHFKNTVVITNSNGLRDEEIPYQKPEGEFRILFLGDSQLFGDGVKQGETFVSLLEKKMKNTQAINAGIIGYGTDQQLLFLKKDGVKYSPNIIVVTLNAYDFQDNISTEIKSGYLKPIFTIEYDTIKLANVPVPNFDLLDRIDRSFKRFSHLYYFANKGLKAILNSGNKNLDEEGFDPGDIFPQASKLKDALLITEKILSAINQEGSRIQSQTVVLFLPYEMDFNSTNYKNKVDEIYFELKKSGKENGFMFWDIRSELSAVFDASCYLDAMHFSAKGHKHIADILLEKFLEMSLIPVSNRVTN